MTGERELLKALDGLSEVDLSRCIGKGISFVQESAKANCPVGEGELRDSIYTAVEAKGGNVQGICFTNKKQGSFVEFGTGPKGQVNHDGISPEVAVAYTQKPWWIHESQLDPGIAEKYHFFGIETKQGKFYCSSGQAAQPFLYPALANNVDKVVKIIADESKRSVK